MAMTHNSPARGGAEGLADGIAASCSAVVSLPSHFALQLQLARLHDGGLGRCFGHRGPAGSASTR